MGEREFVMRRKWLIAILVLLLPVGALATIGAGIDLPSWLSDRMDTLRAAVAPRDRGAASSSDQPRKSATSNAAKRDAGGGRYSTADEPDGRATSSDGAEARRPSIDVARLDPQGSSVIAGLAMPGEVVTILADGKPFAVVTADANGEWVLITAHRFDSDAPTLEVRRGAMELPRAIAEANSPQGTVTRPDVKVQRTAAAVSRRMMRNLERLADNAGAADGAREGATQGEQAVAAAPASNGGAEGSASAAGSGATRVTSRALSTASQEERATSTSSVSATLPVPVHFVYREPVFTPEGEKAAALLLRYFKLKGFKKVALSGHADERGSHGANLQLSKQRLDYLAQYLREGGFEGELELVPKGETEKFTGVDRSQYLPEELWQLDRRVEVMSVE
jgi:outer membrane protein OmpA-like peptidoglycan-associated protein